MSTSQPAARAPSRIGGGPERRNLIEGPIGKTLFLFALPVLGGNALQNLNGTVNAFWVSHSLGEVAVSAISNANIIMMLMLGLVFGVSMASNILIAQAFGGGDLALVKRVVGTATTFFVVLSGSLAILGWLLAPQILRVLKPHGRFAVEIGHDQSAAVQALFRAAGAIEVATAKDLANRDRVVSGRRG